MTTLAQYDRARAALAEATRIDQVLPILDEVEHVKLYAKQINDRELLADASAFQMKCERRLGIVITEARKAGHFRQGRRGKSTEEELSRATLEEVGVDRKLSAKAQRTASISERAFEAMMEGMRDRITSGRAVALDPDKDLSTAGKKQRRENRERVLGECQAALPDKRYGVIYADPEWRFEVYSRETGMDRAADNHYPTSATDAICARPVGDIAAKDSVCFLWATVPMLPDALKVLAAWGFAYKSHAIWKKDRIGTGYWFRNGHELLLVGARGNIPAPAMGTQFISVIESPVGEHSAKPEIFLKMIEAYFPTLPKIELNRRGPARDGWDAWGNESVTEDEAA